MVKFIPHGPHNFGTSARLCCLLPCPNAAHLARHTMSVSDRGTSPSDLGTEDPCSFANYHDIRVTHLSLRWNVQFDKRVLSGWVDLSVETLRSGVTELVLDTSQLVINKVEGTGAPPMCARARLCTVAPRLWVGVTGWRCVALFIFPVASPPPVCLHHALGMSCTARVPVVGCPISFFTLFMPAPSRMCLVCAWLCVRECECVLLCVWVYVCPCTPSAQRRVTLPVATVPPNGRLLSGVSQSPCPCWDRRCTSAWCPPIPRPPVAPATAPVPQWLLPPMAGPLPPCCRTAPRCLLPVPRPLRRRANLGVAQCHEARRLPCVSATPPCRQRPVAQAAPTAPVRWGGWHHLKLRGGSTPSCSRSAR